MRSSWWPPYFSSIYDRNKLAARQVTFCKKDRHSRENPGRYTLCGILYKCPPLRRSFWVPYRSSTRFGVIRRYMLLVSSLLLLLAVTHALQTPHHAPSVASRAGVVHANLNTLRAPPAPPPTIGNGGDGGGGGGEPDEYLRLMEGGELQNILADWSNRGKIYHMSDDRWVQERHASGLDTLERMLEDSDGTKEGRRLSLGLFEEDHVWAVAVAEVSVRSGLQVRSLAVNPSQLHVTDSTAYQRMLHAGMCMRGRSPVYEAASRPMRCRGAAGLA